MKAIFLAYYLGKLSNNNNNNNNNNSFIYPGQYYTTDTSGAEQMTERNNLNHT